MKYSASRFLYCCVAAGLCTPAAAAPVELAALQPGDLMVTEYLANPVGVSDSSAEYFEILNRYPSSVDLAGLQISDDGSNRFTVSALTLGSGELAVFSNGDGSALGIRVDYQYGGGFSLGNADDEIQLTDPGGRELYRVTWSDGDAFGAGVAHEIAALPAGLSLATGPAAGTDYRAAAGRLELGNLGSPGNLGAATPPAVPAPGAAWLLGPAVALLAPLGRSRARRSACSTSV